MYLIIPRAGNSFVDHAVIQLGEFGIVPSVRRSDEIACYALELVYVVTAAFRTFVEILFGILIAAVHAAVAVVVDGTITYVVFVHKIDNVGNGFGIMGGVPVYLDIKNVSAPVNAW